jgi:hypothetical protein
MTQREQDTKVHYAGDWAGDRQPHKTSQKPDKGKTICLKEKDFEKNGGAS